MRENIAEKKVFLFISTFALLSCEHHRLPRPRFALFHLFFSILYYTIVPRDISYCIPMGDIYTPEYPSVVLLL